MHQLLPNSETGTVFLLQYNTWQLILTKARGKINNAKNNDISTPSDPKDLLLCFSPKFLHTNL